MGGIPNTLAGIIGMLIFIIFIVSISASDIYPDQTKSITDAQNNFMGAMNKSVNSTASQQNPGFWGTILGITGLDGIYNFITNFFSMIVSFMIMVIGYTGLLIGISISLPGDFYVFFVLLFSGLIIALIKLVFLNGE